MLHVEDARRTQQQCLFCHQRQKFLLELFCH